MKKGIILLVLLAFAHLSFFPSHMPNKSNVIQHQINTNFYVRYPKSGRPALVLNGMEFNISINSTYIVSSPWQVSIKEIETAKEYYLSVIQNYTEIIGGRYIYNITVRGNNIPPGLYNMTVESDYTAFEPRAIAFYSEFSSSFNFTIINDIHVGYLGASEKLEQFVEIVKVLRPSFVVINGDQADNSQYVPSSYNIIQKFVVPTFVIPGNHEHYNGGIGNFDLYYYWHYYSWTWGTTAYFIAFDSGEGINSSSSPPAQITQEQRDFAESESNLSIYALKFAFIHVPSHGIRELENSSQTWLDNFLINNSFSMLLCGHSHTDRAYNITINTSSVLQLETTSLGKDPRDLGDGYTPYTGFRVISVNNGVISHNVYFFESGNPVYARSEPLTTGSVPAFSATAQGYQNDGTERYIEAKLKNNLNYHSYNLSFMFIMPLKNATEEFVIQGGVISKIIETSSKTYILASANVGPASERLVVLWVNSSTFVMPEIINIEAPTAVYAGSTIRIRIKINECNPPVKKVELYYYIEGVTNKVIMNHTSSNEYEGYLTILSPGTLEYWFVITNAINNVTSTERRTISILPRPKEEIPSYYYAIVISVSMIVIAAIIALLLTRKGKETSKAKVIKIS
ncbi:MAG: metallophosphoesterase [Candidatus Korarchaeota archaeon]